MLTYESTMFQYLSADVERHVDSIFDRLDTNKDGVVTIEEFIESCQLVRISFKSTCAFNLTGRAHFCKAVRSKVFEVKFWSLAASDHPDDERSRRERTKLLQLRLSLRPPAPVPPT